MASVQDTLHLGSQRRLWSREAGSIYATAGWTAEILTSPEPIKAEWNALEIQNALPFMDYAWAEAWYGDTACAQDQEAFILFGRDQHGEPAYILPFVKERRGPFSVLLWPGGTHCAYQCGVFSATCREQIKSHGADVFWTHVFSRLEGIDALALYGLPGLASEADNPLAALPSINASCTSYRFDLSPGWPALYEVKSTSARRREDRRCERRLSEFGEVSFVVAETEAEKERLMEAMLEQKSVQLQSCGAPDFPNQAGIKDFYARLASSPHWSGETELFIAALEVDGDPVSVNLGLIKNRTFYGLIMSMSDGELARFAPGRQALKRTIEHHCAMGLKWFDLGAGEESNKLKWADEPVARRDVLVALTARGHVFTAGMRLFFAAKTKIKASPTLWPLFSRYRKYLGC